MFSCGTVNRIILGKICILDVWYSSVNFLLAFGNHVWKPLVLELGNDFIQLLIHCSSYWINSQLALYNRLHSLLISKLTIFSTANQFKQLYHNENSRIFFEKLWPTWKSLGITGRPELGLAHMVANDRLGILKLMVWTEAMFWNCVTSKIVSLKIAC